MTNGIEFRTRHRLSDQWTEWFKGMDVYVANGTYVQFRIARTYTKGMVLVGMGGVTYEVLSGDVVTQEVRGAAEEYVACMVVYGDGDKSPDFVPKSTLNGLKAEGE